MPLVGHQCVVLNPMASHREEVVLMFGGWNGARYSGIGYGFDTRKWTQGLLQEAFKFRN